MKIARVLFKKKIYWAKVEGDSVAFLKKEPFGSIVLSGQSAALQKVTLLAPCVPSKVILVGLNYKDHARELKMPLPKEPLIFLKPPTAVIGHQANIDYPPLVSRLDYEAELAIVIGKKAKAVPPDAARRYIFGYTCLNDVTARDIQKKEIQWTRAKSYDTFAPLGPWIETKFDPRRVGIALYLNGERKQNSTTAHFIFRRFIWYLLFRG